MIETSLQIFLVMRQKLRNIHLPDRNNSYKSVFGSKNVRFSNIYYTYNISANISLIFHISATFLPHTNGYNSICSNIHSFIHSTHIFKLTCFKVEVYKLFLQSNSKHFGLCKVQYLCHRYLITQLQCESTTGNTEILKCGCVSIKLYFLFTKQIGHICNPCFK